MTISNDMAPKTLTEAFPLNPAGAGGMASGSPTGGGVANAHSSGAIPFETSASPLAPETPEMASSEASQSPDQNSFMEILMQILQLIQMLMMQMMGSGGQDDAGAGESPGAPAGGAPAGGAPAGGAPAGGAPAGGAPSGGAPAGGGHAGGSTSGDEAFGFDANGKLNIGEGFGGWDAVTNPNAKPGEHEYEGTQNMLGTLTGEFGYSGAEARKILDGYRKAAHDSGNDPEHPSIEGKGAGERAKATNMQVLTTAFEQNHGKQLSSEDFIQSIRAGYGL